MALWRDIAEDEVNRARVNGAVVNRAGVNGAEVNGAGVNRAGVNKARVKGPGVYRGLPRLVGCCEITG